MKSNLPVLFFLSIILISCSSKQNSKSQESPNNKGIIPYNLDKPSKTIKLPSELREISALSYYENNLLAAVQDENGIIYMINYKSGKIEQKIKIEAFGDFEGIEIIDRTVYMMKSNGEIIRVKNFRSESPVIEKFDLAFSSKNDCEGLGYDAQKNNLLIACKGKSALAEDLQKDLHLPEMKKYRAIYSVNIKMMKLNTKPEFLLEKKEYEKISKTDDFKPSAIAVHPVSGNIYILASAGKLLVVLDKNGNYLEHIQLVSKIFRQPEGICFSPDGEKLFISNEGKGKKGNILIFEHR